MTIADPRLPTECRIDPVCQAMDHLRARPEILDAVAAGKKSESELALQTRLRKEFPDELVRLAILTVELRRKAIGKFSRADGMWLDRVGYEQSTAESVARLKAQRFPAEQTVWDGCCGIGSDAVALASRGPVVAVDLQPAACQRTLWNAEVYEVADRVAFRLSDVAALPEFTDHLVHLDPDRRAEGAARATRLEDYAPGLEFLQNLATNGKGGAIKVGPASNFGGKFPGAEIELISLEGECKEATIWYGELAGPHPCRATVLPSGESIAGHPLSAAADITPLQTYLYDPDPAIVRSGLVDLCAEQLSLNRLDAAEEYLTAETLVQSPFVTPFRVLAQLSNNDRELRRFLRGTSAGRYEIKCRHIPVQADALRRKLPVQGKELLTIFIARLQGTARMIVAERV